MSHFDHFVEFLAQVWKRFDEDRCLQLAASLAYTTLLALVPLLTIALTLFTAFPGFQDFTKGLNDFFSQHMLPPSFAKTVLGYIEQFAKRAAGLTAVGLAFLVVTAVALMFTIEQAFNHIWRVRKPRALVTRVLTYWGVITLGPLLVGASLWATSYVVGMSLGVVRQVPGAASVLLAAVPVVLIWIAFALLYFVVPNHRVEVRHALIGAAFAALGFELVKRGFALYVSRAPTYATVYGAFAVVPLFLIWIYVSWVVTAFGAVITALLPDWGSMRPASPGAPGAGFRDALSILQELARAQRAGVSLRLDELARRSRLPRERSELLLEDLADAGWVTRASEEHWVLVSDADRLPLQAVYSRFVLAPGEARHASDPVQATVERVFAASEGALALPLSSLLDGRSGEDSRGDQDTALN